MFSSQSTHSTSRSPHPHANFSLSFLLSGNSVPSASKTTSPHTSHLSVEQTVSPNNPQSCSPRAETRKTESIQALHFHTITNAYSRNPRIFKRLQTGGGCFSSKPKNESHRAVASMNETSQAFSFHARTHSFVHNGGMGGTHSLSTAYHFSSLLVPDFLQKQETIAMLVGVRRNRGIQVQHLPVAGDAQAASAGRSIMRTAGGILQQIYCAGLVPRCLRRVGDASFMNWGWQL